MRKLLALMAVMMVMLGIGLLPAAAAPTTQLNALAKHFPADTVMLVSLRTDDAYIKEIDDLFAKIAAQIPNMPAPDRIADQFDAAIGQLVKGGTFDSEVRSWLGDTASLGIMSFEGLMGQASTSGSTPPPHILLAFPVKDQAAAEKFFEAALAGSNGDYEKTSEFGFSIFASSNQNADGIIAIGSDVLFIAAYQEDLPLSGQSAPLSDSATFTESLALLPEPDYNITIYANLGDMLKQMMASMSDQANMTDADMAMLKNMEPLFSNFPPEIIGLTVLDDRSLTIDVALPYGDLFKNYEAAGLSTAMPVPLDPAFGAKILSGTPLVIHSTNLGASLAGLLQNLQAQADMMSSSTGMSADEIEQGLNQIKFAIQGLTGKDLEKDILPALEGDFALYLTLNPALTDVSSPEDLMKQLPVDFGFITEVNDPSVAQALIDAVQMALGSSEDVTLSNEQIAGVDSLIITPNDAGVPFPIDLVITTNQKVFFFGTRRAAEAALRGEGGLTADAAYIEAGQYFVPSPAIIAYFASEGLKPLSKIFRISGSEIQGEQFDAFLNLVSTASISASYTENEGYARIIWTMPE